MPAPREDADSWEQMLREKSNGGVDPVNVAVLCKFVSNLDCVLPAG
jgi:hypothetical protein